MKNKNIPILSATTLFAFLLWCSVSMSEEYQVQVSAPLVIEGLPPGTALAHPLPRSVRLTFKELGWQLAKLMWKSDIRWVVDLNRRPRAHTLTLNDLAQQLGERLGIQPIAMTPESLPIELDSIASKRVAVVPNYSITFAEGYGQVGPVTLTPQSVTITGARRLLQTLDRWTTLHQSFEKVRQTVNATIWLSDTTSTVTLSPDNVSLEIAVQQFAEKSFNAIPIEILSSPDNREIVLNSPYVDVVVRGGIEQLSGVTKNQMRALLDYRAILADTSGFIEPEIRLPNGLQIVRRSPERLGYVVRKKF
jgi:YbbR domain-containing protein